MSNDETETGEIRNGDKLRRNRRDIDEQSRDRNEINTKIRWKIRNRDGLIRNRNEIDTGRRWAQTKQKRDRHEKKMG